MEHFGLSVNYYHLPGFPHGKWMNEVLNNTKDDVVGFIDNDCVPTNKQVIEMCFEYAFKKESFIGAAQATNHIPPCSHIFVAPGFHIMSKKCYEKLGRPTYSETKRSDVAEEVSYVAEEKGVKYRALYPTHYDSPSTDGLWALSNYGYYAIGTHYMGGIYHLYQGRYQINVELFEKRCEQIVNGSFTVNGMKNSLDLI